MQLASLAFIQFAGVFMACIGFVYLSKMGWESECGCDQEFLLVFCLFLVFAVFVGGFLRSQIHKKSGVGFFFREKRARAGICDATRRALRKQWDN